jgi:enamine deaminase RidA (YjgF/YER057c/UK114 family)
MPKQFFNPSGLPKWEDSFSQVVVVHTGAVKTVYLSGQVAVDADNHLVGAGDLKTQAELAFENLERALAAAGASPLDVVKLSICLVDYKPDQVSIVRQAMRKLFQHDELPASTWLGVESLALDVLLIEVDAIAIVEG